LAASGEPMETALSMLGSYLLGCFSCGYYLVRWSTGGDIREQGSRSAGATNVGRRLGPAGFFLTLIGDGLKGALAVWGARRLGLAEGGQAWAVAAVVAGHIWPVQLRFRGGKGVAPCIGGLILLAPWPLLVALPAFALAFAFFRKFDISGLLALSATPVAGYYLGYGGASSIGMAFAIILLLFAHRRNIAVYCDSLRKSLRG
jgi:glycerol-3-phosphate acyltransferase PlsY